MKGLVVILWMLCGYILALVGERLVFGRIKPESYYIATLGAVIGPVMLIPLALTMIVGYSKR